MQFERHEDPKKSIGIGIFRPRNFEYLDDARTWMMQNHVAILGMDGLCKPHPTPGQFAELKEYASKYITVNEDGFFDSRIIIGGVAQLYRELLEVVGMAKVVNNISYEEWINKEKAAL